MIDRALVEILHHISEEFKNHMILKGGLELALMSSYRETNDIDIVLVPFKSKKEIVKDLKNSLEKVSEHPVDVLLSSKMARFIVTKNGRKYQVEADVEISLESIPLSTALVAEPNGLSPRIVKVMAPDIALAHKLAAWNERRLIRDLYDIYFLFSVQNIRPNVKVLNTRLHKIESQLTKLKNVKKMNFLDLAIHLEEEVERLSEQQIYDELSEQLNPHDLKGFATLLKSQIMRVIAELRK